jgi:hypothetical protein
VSFILRRIGILLVLPAVLLAYLVFANYQYVFSRTLLYGIAAACIILWGTVAAAVRPRLKPMTANLIVLLAVAISTYSVYEIYDQIPNLRLKAKLEEYLPNAPIDIVSESLLDPVSVRAYPGIHEQQEPHSNLSRNPGTEAVFLKKAIPPEKSFIQYQVRFKRPYLIYGVDVSEKLCNGLLCDSYFIGVVQVDPENGEMLGLKVFNEGVGK